MSLLEQQVIELRRQMQLLKNSQVSITDTQPKEPSKQSIWREGSTLKTWDGRSWIETSGGSVLDFSTDIVFSSSSYNTISWTGGNVNIGTISGVASTSVGLGTVTMTGNTFLYWSPLSPNSILTTDTPATAITSGGVILAVGQINSDPTAPKASLKTFGNKQNDLITADQIVANSITSNKLAAALIYAGSITLSSGGVIRSGKVTYADTNTGFWLGSDSGTPKFKIGSTTNYLDWNGTNVNIVGGLETGLSGAKITLATSGMLTANDGSGNTIKIDPTNHKMVFQEAANVAYLQLRNYTGVAYLETDAILRTYSALYSSGVSTGQIDASGTINANFKMKLPVGTNLY